MQALAELGFIVVQIDGMGTANRSKAFHDVAGRTSATPASRIASSGTRRWRRSIRTTTSRASASTARRPAGRTRRARCSSIPSSTRWRVRTAAATTTGWTRSGGTSSGWAGRSARTTPRRRTSTTRTSCKGKLLLLVPEMDTNVDPASTMQVVNALIRANKDFELVVVPGAGHGAGGPFTHAQAQRLVRQAPARRRAAELERDRAAGDRHCRRRRVRDDEPDYAALEWAPFADDK